MLSKILHAVLPPRCLVCRASAQRALALCVTCQRQLPYNDIACTNCASPLEQSGVLCGHCQQRQSHYDRVIAPLQYKDDIRDLILGLKFHEKLANARLLARLFHAQLDDSRRPETLIPVPLHPKRLQERGYNQSLELARELSKLTHIRVDARSSRRHRNTERQAMLALKDKRGNVKNAFSVVAPLTARHVTIVDDVMTSGHTIDEFARTLKRAGAERVEAWVMGRTGG